MPRYCDFGNNEVIPSVPPQHKSFANHPGMMILIEKVMVVRWQLNAAFSRPQGVKHLPCEKGDYRLGKKKPILVRYGFR